MTRDFSRQFLDRWRRTDATPFVRIPAAALEAFGVATGNVGFLSKCGLPVEAGPGMRFSCDPANPLPPPSQSQDPGLPGTRLAVIGITAEGWPICLTAKPRTDIVAIDLTSAPRLCFLASTSFEFGAMLLAYTECLAAAVASGLAPDTLSRSWTRPLPRAFVDALTHQLALINKSALQAEGYWSRHVVAAGHAP